MDKPSLRDSPPSLRDMTSFFRVAMDWKLLSRHDLISWADEKIAESSAPDDWIIELATSEDIPLPQFDALGVCRRTLT